MKTAGICIVGLAAIASVGLVHAQAWPSRVVRIVVPWAPGGATDIIGRPLAQKLSDSLGQQFINAEITKVMGSPDFKERLVSLGTDETAPMSQADLTAWLKVETDRWRRIVEFTRIHGD